MTRPALIWKSEGRCDHAMLGQLFFGSIGTLDADPSTWWYTVDAVRVKWITKAHGHVRSKSSARRAVERAWSDWCDVAGIAA